MAHSIWGNEEKQFMKDSVSEVTINIDQVHNGMPFFKGNSWSIQVLRKISYENYMNSKQI